MRTSSQILAADPKPSYLAYKEEIDQAVRRVLDGGWYILGEEVATFESEFADYIGVAHAIGVGSGTDALQLALRTCGVGPDDLVITVSHTAVATVAAIELAGALPLLVDIDPETFTIDVAKLEAAITSNQNHVKAIIPVHLYGHPADMPLVMEIAARHKIFVIEDCAQSHGATVHGRKTGSWGNMAAFSFYPTKNLGALGDGGALVTNDPELGQRARLLRQYGWRERYISELAGMNTRLDEMQAAILRVKLPHLEGENCRRRGVARIYDRMLATLPLLTVPRCVGEVEHVYHQYVVRTVKRDLLAAHLKTNGIGTTVLYPQPVHLQPAYKGRVSTGPGGLPVTEQICQEILCLPMHPHLNDDQVQQVGERILKYLNQLFTISQN